MEWIRVRSDLVATELAAAAGEGMTDGFIAFDPVGDSLLSVDVEEKLGMSLIETTLSGTGSPPFGFCHIRSTT